MRNKLLSSVLTATLLFLVPVVSFATQMVNHLSHTPIKNVIQMGLQKEIWIADVVGTLFKNNVFLNYAINDDAYVTQSKILHVPNAGTASTVVKNRTVFPAAVSERSDNEVSYLVAEFTTDPRRISNADEVELSYSKRDSIIGEDKAKLSQNVAEEVLYSWSPATITASNSLRTSGNSISMTGRMPGQTGNRNAMSEADLRRAMTMFNAQDITMEDRYTMCDAYMYDDLVASMSLTQQRDYSKYYDVAKGVLGQIHTFNIMMRSTVSTYSTGGAVLAAGQALTTTDNCAAICWQKNCVRKGVGKVEFYDNEGQAVFYSDVLSFLVRAGGKINRNDGKGVLAIVQI